MHTDSTEYNHRIEFICTGYDQRGLTYDVYYNGSKIASKCYNPEGRAKAYLKASGLCGKVAFYRLGDSALTSTLQID